MLEVPAAPLALAAAGGVLIGLLYFGTLWWTVRELPSARHPAVLVLGSFLIRAAVAAGGIVFVSGGELLPLAAAVVGFLAGRTILIRAVGKPLRREGIGAETGPPSGRETARRSQATARRN